VEECNGSDLACLGVKRYHGGGTREKAGCHETVQKVGLYRPGKNGGRNHISMETQQRGERRKKQRSKKQLEKKGRGEYDG